MTNADIDALLSSLCDAERAERDARDAVHKAGDKLSVASRRRDELARRVVPIIKANPGRLCKGRMWAGIEYVDCGIFLDAYECVVIEPIAGAYSLAVPMVADAVADSPTDGPLLGGPGDDEDEPEPGPVSVEPIRYLDGLARFAAVRPPDVADVPSDVIAYVNDVLDSRGKVTPDVRAEAMQALASIAGGLGSGDRITEAAAFAAVSDGGFDLLDRLLGLDDGEPDTLGMFEAETFVPESELESGETVAVGVRG